MSRSKATEETTELPRRQGSGLERALGAVDKAVGNATGSAKGTNDTAGDATEGATGLLATLLTMLVAAPLARLARSSARPARRLVMSTRLLKTKPKGRRPVRRPLHHLRKDQNDNILDKLAGSQDFIGKEIKAINEKDALLGKDNAGLAPRAPSTASRMRSSRSPRPTMAENNDRAEHQPEEERNEDFIKTTKPRSRAAGISRKPTASSSLGPDGRIADNA
ncbi:hypothetical protein PG999_004527 [Apiospora kogelbergensis]|uniref:Uncharacterized protein n=1 Tax=Apiospora kogelbergensis TaxID=1337665 RepID=A0AAW0QZM2_9PEZI